MNVGREIVRSRSTDAVFERGVNYRDEGRIQQLDRFGELVTASVSGSKLYDVTVEFGGRSIDARCTCPCDGGGDCKHVVAVLLDIATSPPQDESERVEAVINDVSTDDLRGFVCDALAEHAELREQFLARFGDDHKSVEEYREEIAQLFEQHADPVANPNTIDQTSAGICNFRLRSTTPTSSAWSSNITEANRLVRGRSIRCEEASCCTQSPRRYSHKSPLMSGCCPSILS
jgi:uncharacterized Zn finger protein